MRSALKFDGVDDYIDVGNISSLDIDQTQKFTIHFWIKTTSASASFIINKQDLGAAGKPGFVIELSSGKILVILQNNNVSNNRIRVDSTATVNDGIWHNVIITYEGTSSANDVKIYIDGVEGETIDTDNLSASITNSAPFRIGAASDGTLLYGGLLDEIAIWEDCLSQSEITFLQSNPPARPLKIESIIIIKKINFGSGSFTAEIDNTEGDLANVFEVGNDVIIKVGNNDPPNTVIFAGRLEKQSYNSLPNRDKMRLRGRDYSGLLQDITVLEINTDTEASQIIKNLLTKYAPDITQNNINATSTTINHIAFNRRPLYDCIKEIAEMVNYDFWVDENKDLHFIQENSVSQNITLNDGNITSVSFDNDDSELYNNIWVYGSTYLSGWKESFTADGAGSVFTLQYKPHNAFVTDNGTKKQGGVFELVSTPASGQQYLVDYDNKQIIFVSGTAAGDNIPISGNSIVVDYKRDIPIVKHSRDRESESLYGVREKIIVNKEIKDPNQATDIAKSQLSLNKNPKSHGVVEIKGIMNLNLSDTLVLDFPEAGFTSQTFKVTELSYNINKKKLLQKKILKARLSSFVGDVVDSLQKLMLEVRKIQAGDADTEQLLTRLESTTGSAGNRVKLWKVKTRYINDSFILGHSKNGILRTSGVTYDYTSNNNDGTVYGATKLSSGGKFNTPAYSFDGTNDYIDCGTGTSLNINNAITIAAWIKINSAGNYGIVTKTISDVWNKQYQVDAVAGKPRFRIIKGGVDKTISVNSAFTVGSWTHLVATWDGSTMKTFVNGVQQTETLSVASPIDSGVGKTYIGTLASGTWHFDGVIDEVHIYNKALDAGGIGSLYNGITIAGSLQAYWHLTAPVLGDRRGALTVIKSGVESYPAGSGNC